LITDNKQAGSHRAGLCFLSLIAGELVATAILSLDVRLVFLALLTLTLRPTLAALLTLLVLLVLLILALLALPALLTHLATLATLALTALTLLTGFVLDVLLTLLALLALTTAVALLFLRVRILLARLIAVLRIPRVVVGVHRMLQLRFTWLTPQSST
jgi:hypothetical protein